MLASSSKVLRIVHSMKQTLSQRGLSPFTVECFMKKNPDFLANISLNQLTGAPRREIDTLTKYIETTICFDDKKRQRVDALKELKRKSNLVHSVMKQPMMDVLCFSSSRFQYEIQSADSIDRLCASVVSDDFDIALKDMENAKKEFAKYWIDV